MGMYKGNNVKGEVGQLSSKTVKLTGLKDQINIRVKRFWLID
jgi:hypothetical protein